MAERRRPRASEGEAEAETALRRAVVETAQAMSQDGLSPGRSGNVSARCGDGALITPSGLPYDTLTSEEIVFIRGDGSTAPGALLPSSEWQLHLAVYAAHPRAAAIVHCHSPNATALACAARPIPAFHYMVAVAGGVDIPLAPYATFGTRELADAVAATLEGRRACLLAHHGQIAFGGSLASALDLAREVEVLAMQYIKTLQIGGGPVLGDAAMAEVLAKFQTYGQQKPSASRKPRR